MYSFEVFSNRGTNRRCQSLGEGKGEAVHYESTVFPDPAVKMGSSFEQ